MSAATLTPTTQAESIAAPSYQIAHVTVGRIRFRVPRLAVDSRYRDRLQRAIQLYPFVSEVSINAKAMSLTVCYQSGQVSEAVAQAKIESAILNPQEPKSLRCSTSALAKRLGVALQSINWQRSRMDFADWSQARDPEGIAWRYDADSKKFYPVEACSISPLQSSFFQTLGCTTSEKVGGMVGKLAGEAIGLALLGSTGVIIGAEVGALLGEVVGAELGHLL